MTTKDKILLLIIAFLLIASGVGGCSSPKITKETFSEKTHDSTTTIEIMHKPITVIPDAITANDVPLLKKNDSIQTAEKDTPTGKISVEVNTRRGTANLKGIPAKKDTSYPQITRSTNVSNTDRQREKDTVTVEEKYPFTSKLGLVFLGFAVTVILYVVLRILGYTYGVSPK